VAQALKKLLAEDKYILVNDLSERCISHRLAIYLEEVFPGWNVDCEYNRDRNEVKRLAFVREMFERSGVRSEVDDTIAKTVFPDIIVHKRGTDRNLLVIEIKKSSNGLDETYDVMKLVAFREQMGYRHAAFIRVGTGEEAGEIEWRWQGR
jgi:hypothetical protein